MLWYYFPKDLQCLPQFTKQLDKFMEEKSIDKYWIASPLLKFMKSVIMMCWKPSKYSREISQPDYPVLKAFLNTCARHCWGGGKISGLGLVQPKSGYSGKNHLLVFLVEHVVIKSLFRTQQDWSRTCTERTRSASATGILKIWKWN